MKIKPISKFLKFFLGKNVVASTLYPFGIYTDSTDIYVLNHEGIHVPQQKEMLVIPFYIWYVLEWFIKLFFYGADAYSNISFEREAYANDDNLDYLKTRRHFAWIKYIFKAK